MSEVQEYHSSYHLKIVIIDLLKFKKCIFDDNKEIT